MIYYSHGCFWNMNYCSEDFEIQDPDREIDLGFVARAEAGRIRTKSS